MQIAIASEDGQRVAQHTGRCPNYVVFKLTDGVAERCAVVSNDHTAHARGLCGKGARHHGHAAEGGGPGCHQGILAVLADCRVLIAGGMGRRLAAGVTPYRCGAESVEDAARAFAAGELTPLTPDAACQHHGESAHAV